MTTLDPATLDPGIRDLVILLNEQGFKTLLSYLNLLWLWLTGKCKPSIERV